MANAVSLDDFMEMLERFGGDVANWPLSDSDLQAVAVLLVQSPAAREAVAEMREIEVELRRTLPRAPAGLADRILMAAGVSDSAAQPIRVRPRVRRAAVH
jgi:hypothetical protein